MMKLAQLTMTVRIAIACTLGAALVGGARPASAQLRIVDYNIAQNATFNSNPADLNTVLQAIGAEVRNGFSRQVDIFANQELDENGIDAAFIVGQLNAFYGAGVYAASAIPGNAETGGNGLPSLIYNTQTVSLLDTLAFGNVGSGPTEQPRSTLRYHLRPVGYDAAADFYIYNSHYKSDTGTENQERRRLEAASIRDNSDLLGEGTHALYVGDYNIAGSTEPMYVELMSAGAGQAFDPINTPGNWNGESFKLVHSQSPATVTAFTGQVLGGMNDRFDFQLNTGELQDGEGMSYVSNSYHVFGNNGTHTLNEAISTGTGASASVLGALERLSDHLPVVADYQLPAKMQVQVASAPPTVTLGSPVSVNVMVQNLVAAAAAAFGDELDYTVSVTGDLIGSFMGTASALAAANTHAITLNTATPGLKNGVINVTGTSQGAANAMFAMPVTFTVGGSGGVVRQTIAKDDFDAPINLTNFVQTPTAGTYTVGGSAFQELQVGVSPSIPFALVDDSANGFPTDSQGIVKSNSKIDAWFGVTDTLDNGDPQNNPGGEGTATWTFNVSGASMLEVSIDMAAMGDFENSGVNRDRFDWTYSLDGGAFTPLFTSSVNEAITASYTLADGDTFMVDDPLIMTDAESTAVQLSNVFQTLTSALPGVGTSLQIRLIAKTDGTTEAYAFDNIVVTGLVPTYAAADFNNDGFVNATDLTAWRSGFGTGTTKAQGDSDADGDVDGADFLVWQRQLGLTPSQLVAQTAVPEPGEALAVAAIVAAIGAGRRRAA
jgi:hypothetical protein